MKVKGYSVIFKYLTYIGKNTIAQEHYENKWKSNQAISYRCIIESTFR